MNSSNSLTLLMSQSTYQQNVSIFSSPMVALKSLCKSGQRKIKNQLLLDADKDNKDVLIILIPQQSSLPIISPLTHYRLKDGYAYSVERWMEQFQDWNFWDLVLPASHDSCTYRTQHNYYTLENIIQTQKLTIYEQLMTGVRTLDIRLCYYQKDALSQKELWCCHSILTVPLFEVLQDIQRFLDENPKELLAIRMRPDEFSFDIDNFKHQSGYCHYIDICDKYASQDILDYLFSVMGSEIFIDELYMDTKVKDLIKRNQRIFLLLNNYAYTKKQIGCIEYKSWDQTKSPDPIQTHENCKVWAAILEAKNETGFRFLEHQITLDFSTVGSEELMKGVAGLNSLKGLAHTSNQLLRTWLSDITQCQDISKVNTILFDCVDKATSQAIIEFNFKVQNIMRY